MSKLLDKDLATRLHDLILWDCKRKNDGTPIYPKTVYLCGGRFFMSNPSKYAIPLGLDITKLNKIKVADILMTLGKGIKQ